MQRFWFSATQAVNTSTVHSAATATVSALLADHPNSLHLVSLL
jgi:hypothetical protein